LIDRPNEAANAATIESRRKVGQRTGVAVRQRGWWPRAQLLRPCFRRLGVAVFGAHLFLGLFALEFASFVAPSAWWWLAPFCIVSLTMLGYLVYRTLAAEPAGILYESGLFLAISCAVYYAFGPLLFVIGPAEAADFSRSWYWVNATQSMWLMGLNFIGIGLTGLAYCFSRFPSLANVADAAARRWARVSPVRVFVVFLLIGMVAKYLFVVPFELSLTESVPAGAIHELARLLVIAILVGWIYKDVGPRWIGVLAKLLLLTEVTTGLLMFNKTEVLIVIIAAGLGNYFRRRQLRNLLFTVLVGFVIYALIGPMIDFGRNELVYRGRGQPAPATLTQRFDIAVTYFTGGESHHRQQEIAGSWWSRLNYLSSQQAAVDLHDQGRGSGDLGRAMWIFVPRLVFPGKPIMSNAGEDLYEKVTGFRGSSVGVGVFVDGYYILGWFGVLLASVTYGLSLRAYSAIARSVVARRAVVMYPLAFMGISAGLRSDGMWLVDVAGPVIIVLVLLGLFRLFARR
jgi:hypothetical protein